MKINDQIQKAGINNNVIALKADLVKKEIKFQWINLFKRQEKGN